MHPFFFVCFSVLFCAAIDTKDIVMLDLNIPRHFEWHWHGCYCCYGCCCCCDREPHLTLMIMTGENYYFMAYIHIQWRWRKWPQQTVTISLNNAATIAYAVYCDPFGQLNLFNALRRWRKMYWSRWSILPLPLATAHNNRQMVKCMRATTWSQLLAMCVVCVCVWGLERCAADTAIANHECGAGPRIGMWYNFMPMRGAAGTDSTAAYRLLYCWICTLKNPTGIFENSTRALRQSNRLITTVENESFIFFITIYAFW